MSEMSEQEKAMEAVLKVARANNTIVKAVSLFTKRAPVEDCKNRVQDEDLFEHFPQLLSPANNTRRNNDGKLQCFARGCRFGPYSNRGNKNSIFYTSLLVFHPI